MDQFNPAAEQLKSSRWGSVRKISWEQDREEERAFWFNKTISERLAAMVELNQRALTWNDAEAYDGPAARLVRRTSRR